MKKSRKEFIKRLHEDSHPSWKAEIEKEFPELFKKDALVVGKWYKESGNCFMIRITSLEDENNAGYGFDTSGEWSNSLGRVCLRPILMTDKEVEEALIKEAKKRGLKPLNHRCIKDGLIWNDNIGGNYEFDLIHNTLYIGASCAFQDGKWAEIIKETITKEQAQEATRILVEYNNQ
jgi:hypothetical protein